MDYTKIIAALKFALKLWPIIKAAVLAAEDAFAHQPKSGPDKFQSVLTTVNSVMNIGDVASQIGMDPSQASSLLPRLIEDIVAVTVKKPS